MPVFRTFCSHAHSISQNICEVWAIGTRRQKMIINMKGIGVGLLDS
jgi:hypothetical protein